MFAGDIHIDRSAIERALTSVRGWLRQAYAQPDAYHGMEHAEDVLRLAGTIARRVPGGLKPDERLIVSVAALLHDVGYTAYRHDWAPNRREHVPASITFAQRHLEEMAPFDKHPQMISAVAYLIGYHDDTSYKFPSNVWDGRVGSIDLGPHAAQLAAFGASLPPARRERLRLLLAILREADALTAAGSAGAERTFQYAIHRGLPLFARGNPLNAWCWEESAAGNTRLAAKRTLIDAFTPEGQRAAWESYHATEAYLQGVCAEHGIPYEPESIAVATDSSDPSAVGAIGGTEPALELIAYAGWETLQRSLYNAAFVDAPAVRPYAGADMTVRRLPLDVLPDGPQLPKHEARHATLASLHAHLLSEYALSLFDLTGTIEYRLGAVSMRAAPPIIERHSASTAGGSDTFTIVSGAATIALARELGMPKVWIVEVEVVSDSHGEPGLAWELKGLAPAQGID